MQVTSDLHCNFAREGGSIELHPPVPWNLPPPAHCMFLWEGWWVSVQGLLCLSRRACGRCILTSKSRRCSPPGFASDILAATLSGWPCGHPLRAAQSQQQVLPVKAGGLTLLLPSPAKHSDWSLSQWAPMQLSIGRRSSWQPASLVQTGKVTLLLPLLEKRLDWSPSQWAGIQLHPLGVAPSWHQASLAKAGRWHWWSVQLGISPSGQRWMDTAGSSSEVCIALAGKRGGINKFLKSPFPGKEAGKITPPPQSNVTFQAIRFMAPIPLGWCWDLAADMGLFRAVSTSPEHP